MHRPLKSWRNIKSILMQVLGVLTALWILARKRPAAVIGTGGYICVPTCTAAWLLRVPVFLHESNAFPGLATRFLVNTLRAARQVYLGFASAGKHLSGKCTSTVTGNPVRWGIHPERRPMSKAQAVRKLFGADAAEGTPNAETCVCVCIMGGSLGAEKINRIMQQCKSKILGKFQDVCMIWQTGDKHYEALASSVENEDGSGSKRLALRPFLHDMETIYAACDLFVCRAGALTCSELLVSERPSILIPSPNVTEDHQTKNAAVLSGLGGAVVIEEERLSVEALLETLDSLLSENARELREMKLALREHNTPSNGQKSDDACDKITKSIAAYLS